jgi:hypothetical protein
VYVAFCPRSTLACERCTLTHSSGWAVLVGLALLVGLGLALAVLALLVGLGLALATT